MENANKFFEAQRKRKARQAELEKHTTLFADIAHELKAKPERTHLRFDVKGNLVLQKDNREMPPLNLNDLIRALDAFQESLTEEQNFWDNLGADIKNQAEIPPGRTREKTGL